MEPILTQEELEAIYSAMKADVEPMKSVDDYSIASDHSYNMRCLKSWTNMAKRMTGQVEQLFIGALAIRGDVTIQEVRTIEDERNHDDSMGNVGVNEVSPLAQTDPDSEFVVVRFSETKMLMGLERPLAMRYVNKRTGSLPGGEDDEQDESPESITLLERSLLTDFFKEVAEVISAATPELGRGYITRDEPEDFWLEREPRGIWMDARLSSENHNGFSLWLRGPADIFLPEPTKTKQRVKSSLSRTSVEMVAELGRFNMSVLDLWSLKPGQTISLSELVGDALTVTIGGVRKMSGMPVLSRGNIALKMLGNQEQRGL